MCPITVREGDRERGRTCRSPGESIVRDRPIRGAAFGGLNRSGCPSGRAAQNGQEFPGPSLGSGTRRRDGGGDDDDDGGVGGGATGVIPRNEHIQLRFSLNPRKKKGKKRRTRNRRERISTWRLSCHVASLSLSLLLFSLLSALLLLLLHSSF